MGVAGVSAQGRVQAHLGLFQVLAFGADTGLPPYHQLSDLQSEGFLLSWWFPHSGPLDRHKGALYRITQP